MIIGIKGVDMAQYKVKKRVLPNGNLSKEYYAQILNEKGKKVWLKLGPNYKEAEKRLKAELEVISAKKRSSKNVQNGKQTLLEYLVENHYFEPELNVQYIFFKRTGRESYGLNHSKQVASYFHRLFDEDKANDEIGRIPYREISHKDALGLWQRLEVSEIFKTNGVRNRLLDMLSSTYRFIQKDDRDLEENPFRTISPFDDRKEQKEREGMTIDQIRLLFADEDTINTKIIRYLIESDEKEHFIFVPKSDITISPLFRNIPGYSNTFSQNIKL